MQMPSMFYIFISITKTSEIQGSLHSSYVYMCKCKCVGIYHFPPVMMVTVIEMKSMTSLLEYSKLYLN